MIKWLLLVWLQTNDPTVPPIPEPVVIERFDTYAACTKAKVVYGGVDFYRIVKRQCKKGSVS